MTNTDAPQDNDHRPAVGGPVQRQVRALEPERAAFEVFAAGWGLKTHRDPEWHAFGDQSEFDRPYYHGATCAAWAAWQAARPKRAAVGRLVNMASVLTGPDPMRKLWQLEEEAGRTLGRRALSDAMADSDERLKTIAIELAALARAL